MVTDTQIEAAHGALADIAFASAQLIKIDISNIKNSLDSIKVENDRTCCIVSFSIMEDVIKSLFRGHLVDISKQNEPSLFGDFGLYGSTTRIVRASYHLGWIGSETVGAIRLLAKIRNEFAHNYLVHKFEDEKIRSLLSSTLEECKQRLLMGYKAAFDVRDDENMHMASVEVVMSNYMKNWRFRYNSCYMDTLLRIVLELRYMAIAKSMLISPDLLISREFSQSAELSYGKIITKMLLSEAAGLV